MKIRATKTEKVKGFKVIQELSKSDTEYIRISTVDISETPFPYIVEIFKLEEGEFRYKTGNAFKKIEEAQDYIK